MPTKSAKADPGEPKFCPGWGARLRQARLARGLAKQRQLASLVGIEAVTVSRHETEARTPLWRDLHEYCRVLDIDMQWLLFGTGKGPDSAAPHHDLIESYKSSPYGVGCRKEVIAQLRRVNFADLGVSVPTLEHVHDVRLFLDRHTGKR